MDETVIVIMLRNPETGFLEKELGCYTLTENESLIYNTYAADTDGHIDVYLKLTVEEDVDDWQFNAIFDYYDTDAILPFVESISLDTEQYNPMWLVTFSFIDDVSCMEDKLSAILHAHKQELASVMDVIADKKDDYIDKDN